MATETEADWAEKIGKPAYESIAEMVAALNCDYERLEELRDERDAHEIENPSACDETVSATAESIAAWAGEYPDDAEELAGLEAAAGDCKDQDEARERIGEDALDITIRGERVSGEWEADEFEILLCTGGPAVRIKGDLANGEPSSATLEVQDWSKPWTPYTPISVSEDTLLSYCRCFYFAE